MALPRRCLPKARTSDKKSRKYKSNCNSLLICSKFLTLFFKYGFSNAGSESLENMHSLVYDQIVTVHFQASWNHRQESAETLCGQEGRAWWKMDGVVGGNSSVPRHGHQEENGRTLQLHTRHGHLSGDHALHSTQKRRHGRQRRSFRVRVPGRVHVDAERPAEPREPNKRHLHADVGWHGQAASWAVARDQRVPGVLAAEGVHLGSLHVQQLDVQLAAARFGGEVYHSVSPRWDHDVCQFCDGADERVHARRKRGTRVDCHHAVATHNE